MNRTHYSLYIVLAGILALPLLSGCRQRTLKIRSYIDGSDVMKVSGNKIWIEHGDFDLPGRNGGQNFPTYINGIAWMPEWTNNISAPYEGVKPAFAPQNVRKIKLVKNLGRGEVAIVDTPSFATGTLAIKFDDNAEGGAAWYEIVVSW